MKKLTIIALIGLLSVSSVNAKEIFDLRVQEFLYPLKHEQNNARYKINDNVIIETNTFKASRGGYYYTKDTKTKGLFNIWLYESLSNWT